MVESEIKSYTIKASNEAGFDSIEITLQIVQPIPYFRYSDEYQFVKGDTITSISPEIIEGQSTNWQIQPSLPNGLMFNSVNGFISGTPHVISQSETYTVTATNSLGDYSDSFLISIVNDTQNLTNDSTSVGNEDNNSDSQNIDNQNTDAINDGEDDISTNQILIIIALFGIVIFFLQRDNNPEIHLTQTIHPAVVESTHTETSKIIWIEKNEREVVTRENEVKNEYGTVENYVLDKIKRLESLNELQYITSFQFPEDVMIEFEIVAARAYPILGPNPMKEAEAAEILKNELSNLTRVLGGATISPAVGSWLPVDKKYDLEWDKSISIRISLLANKFLEPNKFQSFIDAILDFSENHCQKFMQESVLISIRFDKQFEYFIPR